MGVYFADTGMGALSMGAKDPPMSVGRAPTTAVTGSQAANARASGSARRLLCYALVLPGRKSGFRAGFPGFRAGLGQDFYREIIKIGSPAGRGRRTAPTSKRPGSSRVAPGM